MFKSAKIILLVFTISAFAFAQAPNAWINEIHYDNDGTDTGEALEIAVASDFTDLSNFTVTLYNGNNSSSYGTTTLNNFTVGSTVEGYTFYHFEYPSNGIQNGSPDGLAIDYNGTVIQFLSYEGTITAIEGVANGLTSVDIGIEEPSTSAIGNSLQLTGSANSYSGFSWAAEIASTFGSLNTGQSILPAGADTPPTISAITFDPLMPSSSDAVSVSAVVTDNNSVTGVELTWGTDGTTYPNSITMNSAVGDTFVTATDIPAQAAGATIYFVINATDDASQTSTSPQQSYQIPASATISEIQSGSVAEGTLVQISGIVTGGTGELSENGFYLQDGTGQYSGINVFTYYYNVARGDEITLVGEYVEYNSKSEIENLTSLVINSSGNAVPAPEVLTLDQADWEPWEGVLVQIEDVAVSNIDAGYGEWEVSDGTNFMRIDNSSGGHYSYTPILGDQFTSITGPLNYTHDVFKIIPRSDEDIVVFIDLTLPVADAGDDQQVDFGTTVTLDGSGSSDSDGMIVSYVWEQLSGPTVTLSDYEEAVATFTAPSEFTTLVFKLTVLDNSAQSATDEVSIIVGSQTIYDVQFTSDAGTGDDCYPSPLLDQSVTVSGIVTAVAPGTYPNFYIQDSDGAEYTGIYVYDDTIVPTVGDELSLTADVEEYFGFTELKNVSSSTVLSTGNVINPVDISTGDLANGCNALGEALEGMLVRVTGATVTQISDDYGQWYIDDGSGVCQVDDGLFDGEYPDPAVGAVYTLVGVVDYSYGEFGINPRGSDDLNNLAIDELEPTSYSLMTSYPNPFNPSTTISYQLETSGLVELSIYNIKGQLVRNLVSELKESGRTYKAVWNGQNQHGDSMPSGIYLTRLTAENLTLTNKITLLK